ncbi:MAG: DUF3576 domain-containing protein [Geminicoccaceae bacterium]
MTQRSISRAPAFVLLGLLGLASCGTQSTMPDFTVYDPREQRQIARSGTFTGREGITIFGTGNSPAAQQAAAAPGGGGIGVNAYLWRGALETLNFMPLASADPFGGLIITDWYQPTGLTDERLKVQVLILDRSLRADGVKVSVIRQQRDPRGDWVDEAVDPQTVSQLEDKILTKARELRIAGLETMG